MAIELPDLVQRIRVDASELGRAEKSLAKAGAAYEDAAESADRLEDSTDRADDATRRLRRDQDDSARSSDRASTAARRLAGQVSAVRDATEGTRRATEGAVESTDGLREAELRMEVAQRRVAVAQDRLNRLRSEGKADADTLARAELTVIDALRRVAREQQVASRAHRTSARDSHASTSALVGFVRTAEKAARSTRFLGLAVASIKIPAVITAVGVAVGGLSALGAGAVALIGQLGPVISGLGTASLAAAGQFGPLVGAIGSLPAALLAVKSATGVFKSLTEDPQKAAEAIRKYGRDSDQAKEALAALTPEARRFSLELEDTLGRFESIRRAGQTAALPGLTRALTTAQRLLPVVQTGFVQAGRALAGVARHAANVATQPAFRRDLGIIAGRNATLIRTLGRAAVSLVSALRGVVLAAGPMTQAFADAARRAAELIDVFVNSRSGQARLAAFFERTQRVVFSLGRSLRDLGIVLIRLGQIAARAVGVDMVGGLEDASARLRDLVEDSANVTRIGGYFARTFTAMRTFGRGIRDLTVGLVNLSRIGGQAIGIDFVGGMERAGATFREFTKSASGQSRIARYFADARPVLVETGRLLRDIARGFAGLARRQDLAPVITKIRTELLPAIGDLVTGVSGRLGPALVDMAVAFTKFLGVLSFSPIITVAAALAKLANAVLDIVAATPGLSTVVASLIALRVALTSLAIAGKVSGLTGLASSIAAAGAAGTVGARGFTGVVQGIKGLNTVSDVAVTRANRFGAALRGVNVSASGSVANVGRFRGAVGGVASALGGPWTLAIGAAITGLTIYARKHAEAKARVEELTAAIQADSGALAENTHKAAANTLEKSGALKDAQRLGISLDTLTAAYLGNQDAINEVRAVTTRYGGTLRSSHGALVDRIRGLDENTAAAIRLRDAVQQGNADTVDAVEKARRLEEATGGVAAAYGDAAGAAGTYADATGVGITASRQARAAFIRLEVQTGKTRREARRLADEILGVNNQSPVRVEVETPGLDPAIARIAEFRRIVLGIPTAVTVNVLNKITGADGALGPPVPKTETRTSPRVAERAAQETVKRTKDKVEKEAADVGYTAGATAGEAAGSSFSNEFVKSAGGELTKSGQRLVENLVKALTGSTDRIRDAAKSLRELIRGAFAGATEDRLLARVKTVNKRLLELAKQRDELRDRIKQARDDIISGAQQAGAGLRDTITGSGNPTTSGDEEGRTNILRIIGNLRQKVEAAKRFASDLRALKKRGINADTLRQLVEAGPEAGGVAARELARATDAQLAEVNQLQGTLTATGTKAGEFAEKTLEKMGLDAIGGLLRGLRSRRSEVEAEMLKIARSMTNAIRKALAIRSPSRVFHVVGDLAVAGLLGALRAGRRAVAAVADRLGKAAIPAIGPVTVTPPGAGAPGAPPGTRRPPPPGAAGLLRFDTDTLTEVLRDGQRDIADALRDRTAPVQGLASVPLASTAGGLPQPAATTVTGDRIGNLFHIDLIQMDTTNPKPEPLAEVTAPDNLRKVAAVLSR